MASRLSRCNCLTLLDLRGFSVDPIIDCADRLALFLALVASGLVEQRLLVMGFKLGSRLEDVVAFGFLCRAKFCDLVLAIVNYDV